MEKCEFCGKKLNRHMEVINGQEKRMYLCTACFHHLYPEKEQRDRLYARGEHYRKKVRK